MNKKISFLGVFLMLLVAFAGADLVFDPTSADFGTVSQNSDANTTLTITNPDPDDATNITLSAGNFNYSNDFIGTYEFDGSALFDPNDFTLIQNESQEVDSTINVPLITKMGEYTAVFTATYNGSITQDIIATVFVDQYTGRVGDLDILDTDSYDDVPDQMRVGRTFEMDLIVENEGNEDLNDVKLVAWLYNSDIKQIVALDESSEQTIDSGEEETFTVEFDVDEDLDEDDNYDLYVKVYKINDELNQHDVKVKDMNLLGEDDLCDIGDLKVEKFDLDENDYSPGDTIQIDIEIENRGSDDIDDVIVEVWLTEEGKTKKLEEEESDKTDIREDDTESFYLELDIDDDLDDGNYEVHVRAYEKGNDDEQCIEELEDIDIERPDHKVIIDEIVISPTTLSCEASFTAEMDVKNVGDKDDDAVRVRMYNSDLGIDVYSDTFDLESFDERGDDETIFLTAQIPEGSDNKQYALTFTLYYYDLEEQKNYVETITVSGCEVVEDPVEENESEEDQQDENQENNQGWVFLPTGWAGLGLDEGTWTTIFWILGDIVLVIVAIYFLVLLFKKRR
jgi:uncharacterized membrane protein